jgi:hypothetical protein
MLAAVLPVILTGCLGSSGHGASFPTAGIVAPVLTSTSLRVSYPVGDVVATRSRLAACPNRATCHDVHLGDCPAGARCVQFRDWIRVAVRQLTCSPTSGDYGYPRAACAALDDLEHLLHTGQSGVCYCALVPDGYPMAQAVGRYKGHRVKIGLDECSLCGLGAQAAHDAAALTRHRQATRVDSASS